MDPNTREWTDGLFTHILRKIIDNVRGTILFVIDDIKNSWLVLTGTICANIHVDGLAF